MSSRTWLSVLGLIAIGVIIANMHEGWIPVRTEQSLRVMFCVGALMALWETGAQWLLLRRTHNERSTVPLIVCGLASAFLLLLVFSWELYRFWGWVQGGPVLLAGCLGQVAIAAMLCRYAAPDLWRSLVLVAVLYFIAKVALVLSVWYFARMAHDPQAIESALETRAASSAGQAGGATPNGPSLRAFRVVRADGERREVPGNYLARMLDERAQELLGCQSVLRYAFRDDLPDANYLTYLAFRSVLSEALGAERATSIHDTQLSAEDQGTLVDALRGEKTLFLTVAQQIREQWLPTYSALMVLDIFLGKSYGIHLAVYLLFAYCVLRFRVPAGQRFVVEPGSSLVTRFRRRREIDRELGKAPEARLLEDAELLGYIERIHFCRETMPQLGFIGTLLGLSFAILQLASIDVVQEILQRPGISAKLAANLGLAFNTTFVSLLMTVVMNLYFSRLASVDGYYRRLTGVIREGRSTGSTSRGR